jgi:hypothetical protein
MHPHFPAGFAYFQDHLVLETDPPFRIIFYASQGKVEE